METSFSAELQNKIETLKARRTPLQLGGVHFASPLLLAPMSSICNAPFRLLMEELGAGGTVSELISCHGINHGNKRTRKMLQIAKNEMNVGIQLFGEEASAMARAARVAEEYNPKFIDINMGCPVKKVVTKGSGSALMKEPSKLGKFFAQIKKEMTIPLSIKIRTGWDEESINAQEVMSIAFNEGIEFVAIHGRTRAQAYRGQANWKLINQLAHNSPLPLIGNGDLHTRTLVKKAINESPCQAFMLARGPLRYPFIFLEAYLKEGENLTFNPRDYLEIIEWLTLAYLDYCDDERNAVVQMRKFAMWFAAGFPHATQFRAQLFKTVHSDDLLELCRDYFLSLSENRAKQISENEAFMTSGHG